MSFQWTVIAAFLYFEIALVTLLLLPFISSTRWQSLIRSKLLKTLSTYSNIYFNVFIVALLIMFFDAIREMRKYSYPLEKVDLHTSPYAESTTHMKLFRAQRNFYIAGFSLFLWLVLRRLLTLISSQASMTANAEASRRQAESATAAARQLMDDHEKSRNETDTEDTTRQSLLEEKLDNAKQELTRVNEELDHARLDLMSMKKQAEATNLEYDRLLVVNEELQKKIESTESGPECKKDN